MSWKDSLKVHRKQKKKNTNKGNKCKLTDVLQPNHDKTKHYTKKQKDIKLNIRRDNKHNYQMF